jgi:hypothetical protein
MNDELEMIWKEAIVAKLRYLPKGTEEGHEKPQSQ